MVSHVVLIIRDFFILLIDFKGGNVWQLKFCKTYYPTSISTNKYFPTSICFEILFSNSEQFTCNGHRRRDSVSNDLIWNNFQIDIEVIATDRHSGEMKTNPNIIHVKHQFDHWAF